LVHEGREVGPALSARKYARLRDEIEAQYQSAAKAGRPMLLDGG
jgi:phage portal protein BeeE